VDVLLVYDDREEIREGLLIKNEKHCVLKDLEGMNMPNAIIINSSDNAYLKQTFTKGSLEWLKSNTAVL
jgi:hypothetical protein